MVIEWKPDGTPQKDNYEIVYLPEHRKLKATMENMETKRNERSTNWVEMYYQDRNLSVKTSAILKDPYAAQICSLMRNIQSRTVMREKKIRTPRWTKKKADSD